jgi:phosphomannomutase
VVVGSLDGGPGGVARETLRALGYRVLEGPALRESGAVVAAEVASLGEELSRAVRQQGAHLGVLYGGNGRRAVFADETGALLTPQQALVLLARALLRYEPGSQVVCDEHLGPRVESEIRLVGGDPVLARSEPAAVKRLLLQRGAVLGADAEGHYCFRTMGAEDALYATLVMLRISSRLGRALRPEVRLLDV